MRAYGINYDTGLTVDGRSTRPSFAAADVRRDLAAISSDLHANAIRVSGDDIDRLELTGRYALEAGLEVWFFPMSHDLEADEFVDYVLGWTPIAEHLRAHGDVVAVLGCEMSLFCSGFVPGEGFSGRMTTMTDPATWTSPDRMAAMRSGLVRFRDVQRVIVESARSTFRGRLTYAAGTWEDVEWDAFDIVSVDAYRDAGNSAGYRDQIRAYGRIGKPMAITEFGCCTFAGASARGGTGWLIFDPKADPPQLDGRYQRDEAEQVHYFQELMKIYDTENVDSAFWFSFAGFALPHRDEPVLDLDMASYGVVAVEEPSAHRAGITWVPKEVFHAISADFERRHRRGAR